MEFRVFRFLAMNSIGDCPQFISLINTPNCAPNWGQVLLQEVHLRCGACLKMRDKVEELKNSPEGIVRHTAGWWTRSRFCSRG